MSHPTNRQRVLGVINSAPDNLSGREVAQRAGLTHRQTLDALSDLHDQGLIVRHGRKSTSRWASKRHEHVPQAVAAAHDLEQAFKGFFR